MYLYIYIYIYRLLCSATMLHLLSDSKCAACVSKSCVTLDRITIRSHTSSSGSQNLMRKWAGNRSLGFEINGHAGGVGRAYISERSRQLLD